MEYLLLAVLSIIIYTEIFSTLSMFFELIRTWFACKIAILQQYTMHVQEDIQDTQERMQPKQSQVIGFHVPHDTEDSEDDYE